jgi:hypothetical protein
MIQLVSFLSVKVFSFIIFGSYTRAALSVGQRWYRSGTRSCGFFEFPDDPIWLNCGTCFCYYRNPIALPTSPRSVLMYTCIGPIYICHVHADSPVLRHARFAPTTYTANGIGDISRQRPR